MKTALAVAFSFSMLLGAALPAGAQEPAPTGTSGTTPAAPVNGGPSTEYAAALPPEYRLVPGDKLRVEVYKDAQLSQSLQIRPDGMITLPLLGDIAAAGRTPMELRDEVAQSLEEYITSPTVTVIVVEATPQMVYVMGEVNSPGPQAMRGQMTVLQALAMAGGFRDFANTRNIRILRRTPNGVDTLRFNYRQAMQGRTEPMYLQPGDTVIVP